MKFIRLGLVTIAIVAFSLAAVLSIEPEPPQEIEIKVTPYQELVESEVIPLSLSKLWNRIVTL